MKYIPHQPRGFSLLEVILATALFLLLASGIAMLVIHSLAIEYKNTRYLQAVSFAEEGREAVRFIRKAGYDDLGTLENGGVTSDGQGGVRLDEHPNVFGQFERSITIGDTDEFTKQVDIRVSWSNGDASPFMVELTDILVHWERPY